ncbi:MAG: AAA family ATPase [Chloroflexota bacterium]
MTTPIPPIDLSLFLQALRGQPITPADRQALTHPLAAEAIHVLQTATGLPHQALSAWAEGHPDRQTFLLDFFQARDLYGPAYENLELKPASLASLLSQPPPPLAWLIDNLLAPGHLLLLAGRPKTGKTWLALQLAHALDTGQPFLGLSTRPGRLLYLALQDSPQRIQQRAHLLHWQPRQADFCFHLDPLSPASPALDQLQVTARRYALLILDTLAAALAPGLDDPSQTAVLHTLLQLAHTTQTAILLIHQTAKANPATDDPFQALLGPPALRRACDVGLLLLRQPPDKAATLLIESRDAPPASLTLAPAANGPGWQPIQTPPDLLHLRAGRSVIRTMLEEGDGLTLDHLAGRLNLTRQAVYSQLRYAEKHGYVYRTRDDDPHRVSKPADRWWLTDHTKDSHPHPAIIKSPISA